jgi:hypothetical protein
MVKSSIGNSSLLITRTLPRHKHQLRDFSTDTPANNNYYYVGGYFRRNMNSA